MGQDREIIRSSLRSSLLAVKYLAMLAHGQRRSESCTFLPSHLRQAEVATLWLFFTVPLAEQQELCPTLAIKKTDATETAY